MATSFKLALGRCQAWYSESYLGASSTSWATSISEPRTKPGKRSSYSTPGSGGGGRRINHTNRL